MGSSSSVASGSEAGSAAAAPPTLYIHPFSTPCRAVLMVAGAAKIKLSLKKVDLLKGDQLKEKFIKINPDHVVPTLVDGSFTLWESRAILAYLVDKYGGEKNSLYPKDLTQRATVNRLLLYDMGTAYKHIGEFVYPQIFKKEAADEEKQKEVEKVLDYLENILKKQPHVAGPSLTIADLSLISNVNLLEAVDWNFEKWPAVGIWMESIKKHSWYAEANKGLASYRETKEVSMD